MLGAVPSQAVVTLAVNFLNSCTLASWELKFTVKFDFESFTVISPVAVDVIPELNPWLLNDPEYAGTVIAVILPPDTVTCPVAILIVVPSDFLISIVGAW